MTRYTLWPGGPEVVATSWSDCWRLKSTYATPDGRKRSFPCSVFQLLTGLASVRSYRAALKESRRVNDDEAATAILPWEE